MSEKKKHYYIKCVNLAENTINREKTSGSWLFITQFALLILSHIADRLADLVEAIEEQTEVAIYPVPRD